MRLSAPHPAAVIVLAAVATAAVPARAQVSFGTAGTPITVEFINPTLAPATSYDFGVGLRQNTDVTLVRLDRTPVRLGSIGGRLALRVPLGIVTLSAPHTPLKMSCLSLVATIFENAASGVPMRSTPRTSSGGRLSAYTRCTTVGMTVNAFGMERPVKVKPPSMLSNSSPNGLPWLLISLLSRSISLS